MVLVQRKNRVSSFRLKVLVRHHFRNHFAFSWFLCLFVPFTIALERSSPSWMKLDKFVSDRENLWWVFGMLDLIVPSENRGHFRTKSSPILMENNGKRGQHTKEISSLNFRVIWTFGELRKGPFFLRELYSSPNWEPLNIMWILRNLCNLCM